MPQVPYSPIPQTAPSEAGTPGVSVSTPIAAFGGTVAQALEGLGKQVEHSGNQIWQQAVKIQGERNEAEARWADAEYMKAAGEIHAKFNSLEGNAIAEAYPKYITDLRKARMDIRDNLTNEAVKKTYDGPSISFEGRSIFNGAGVAAAGVKQARRQAQEAQLDQFRNSASANPGDDIGFLEMQRRTQRIIESQAAETKADPAVTVDRIQKADSALKSDRIIGMARTQPMTAMQMLKDYGPDLTHTDRERVENMVYGRAANVTGRNTADKVLEGIGSEEKKTLKDYVEEGNSAVEKMNIEDESLRTQVKSNVESNIIAKYNRFEKQQHDVEIKNRQVIDNALIGGYTKGNIPLTMDDLLHSSPEVQQAYDDLKPEGKRRVMNQVAQQARQGNRVDEATSYKTRQQYEGMAQSDPNKFIDADLWGADVKLNPKDRQALLRLRDQKIKTPEQDPHVARALNWVRADRGAEMTALDIYNRSGTKEKYDEFVGGLSMAIQDFQENNKKAPTKKDVLEMADGLMYQSQSSKWFTFGIKTKDKPLFDETPPDEFTEKLGREMEGRGRPTPSAEVIKREWLRQRWKELHGGSVKSETGE